MDENLLDDYVERLQSKIAALDVSSVRTLVLVFEEVAAALGPSSRLAEDVRSLSTRGISSIAYIPAGETAGIILALSCEQLLVGRDVTVGGIPAPTIFGDELPRKIREAHLKLAVSMAGGRDIPRCVIQSLVLSDLDVYRVTIEGPQGQTETRLVAADELAELEAQGTVLERILIVSKGQPLSLSAEEALEFGIVDGIVDSHDRLVHWITADRRK